MARRFVKSVDGIERCTITVKFRFTKEEMELLDGHVKKANARGQEKWTVNSVVWTEASLAMDGLFEDIKQGRN